MTEPFIFSISENLKLQINETTIICNRDYSQENASNSLQSHSMPRFQAGGSTIQFAVGVKSFKSTFQQCGISGQGGSFNLLSTTFSDQESIFSQLSASQGGAFNLVQSTASFRNSKFYENLAQDAGVIYLSQSSFARIVNSQFYDNKAFLEAGVIYIESGSYADISGCQIYNNYALKSSFMSGLQTSSTQNVTLSNSEIYDNIAEANTISLVRGSLLISGCNFENNLAYQSSKNIFAGFSSVSITQTTFRGVKRLNEKLDQTIGSAILVILDVQLLVEKSNFLNGFSQYGAAIYVSGEADIRLSGCQFSGNRAQISGGAIYASGYKQIQIDKNSALINNAAQDKGDDIYISNSQGFLNIFNSKIQNPKASLSIYAEYASINMTQLTMSDIATQGSDQDYGSALQCINCYQVHIKSSTFTRLKSVNGGAFYFFESTQSKQSGVVTLSTQEKYLIERSAISYSQAVAGGAIYFDNILQARISDCEFSNNKALNASGNTDGGYQGSGGAIFFECLNTDLNCQLIISGTTLFKNNFASIQGGAIHWTMIEPEFGKQVSYVNNTAAVYGQNISCFVQNIAKINRTMYEQVLRKFGKIQDERLRNLQILKTDDGVSSQRSGGSIPDIYLCFVDKYGQTVTTDSDSKIRVSVDDQDAEKASKYLKYPFQPVIDGTQIFQLESGVTLASGIVFSATPGQSYSLVFTSDAIDQSKPSNKEYLQSKGSKENAFQLQVQLRDCLVGEQYTSTGQCQSCPAGSSYSIIKMTSPGSCKECPVDKAFCNGGSNIGPKPGFWRSSSMSDDFISCQYYYACLGMIAPDYNPQGSCLEGYQGIICADCAPGYSRSADYKCSSCPSEVTNFMRLLFIFIAALIFVSVIVYATLSGARQQKNVTNIFIKIMMNHFQLIFLTASFNLSWPPMVLELFSALKPVAQISQQVFSFDCFIDARTQGQIEDENENEEITFRIFYIKLILYSIAPFGVMIGSGSFWLIYSKAARSRKSPRNRIITTIIILLFLIHPSLTQYFFSDFDCISIDGIERLQIDLQILCWEKVHKFFSYFVAIPSVLIWGLGIPMTALSLLNRYRHKLDSISVRENLGFLYRGYRKEYYYWEIWIMFRKIGLVSIQVFIGIFGTTAKALAVLFLLAASIVVNLKHRPFSTTDLNDLETISLLSSLITIYCGIFYLSNVTPKIIQKLPQLEAIALQLSQSTMTFLFVVIILVNAIFFGYWSFRMYMEIKFRLVEKWPKVYMVMCSCGSIESFNRVKLEIQVKDENESLKEKFTKILMRVTELQASGKIVLNDKNIEKLQVYFHKDRLIDLLEAGPHKKHKWKLKDLILEKYEGKSQLRFKRLTIKTFRNQAGKILGNKNIENIDILQSDDSLKKGLRFSKAVKDSSQSGVKSGSSKTRDLDSFSSQSQQTVEEFQRIAVNRKRRTRKGRQQNFKSNSWVDQPDRGDTLSPLKINSDLQQFLTPDRQTSLTRKNNIIMSSLDEQRELGDSGQHKMKASRKQSKSNTVLINFNPEQHQESLQTPQPNRSRKGTDHVRIKERDYELRADDSPASLRRNMEQMQSFSSDQNVSASIDESFNRTQDELNQFGSTSRTDKKLLASPEVQSPKRNYQLQMMRNFLRPKIVKGSSPDNLGSELKACEEEIQIIDTKGYRNKQNQIKHRIRKRKKNISPQKSKKVDIKQKRNQDQLQKSKQGSMEESLNAFVLQDPIDSLTEEEDNSSQSQQPKAGQIYSRNKAFIASPIKRGLDSGSILSQDISTGKKVSDLQRILAREDEYFYQKFGHQYFQQDIYKSEDLAVSEESIDSKL